MSIVSTRVPARPRSRNFNYYITAGDTGGNTLSLSSYVPQATEDLTVGAVEQTDAV